MCIRDRYYTLDGTVPDTASQRYTAPFSITDSCTLTLRCYNRRGVAAEMRRASFRPTRYAEPSADAGNLQNGLLVRWYDYDGDNCADIDEAPLQANFITDSVEMCIRDRRIVSELPAQRHNHRIQSQRRRLHRTRPGGQRRRQSGEKRSLVLRRALRFAEDEGHP